MPYHYGREVLEKISISRYVDGGRCPPYQTTKLLNNKKAFIVEWIIFDQRLNEDKFFELVGKAIFLCQRFEHGCKNMVMWFSLAKALYEKQFKCFSQNHKDYVDQLIKFFLAVCRS